MGSLTPIAIGERVYFKLSDLPIEIREKGALLYAEQASRELEGYDALLASAAVWKVARNPNGKVFNVSQKAWLKVMKVLP